MHLRKWRGAGLNFMTLCLARECRERSFRKMLAIEWENRNKHIFPPHIYL